MAMTADQITTFVGFRGGASVGVMTLALLPDLEIVGRRAPGLEPLMLAGPPTADAPPTIDGSRRFIGFASLASISAVRAAGRRMLAFC